MIEIDGSMGEGGGQIIRTAVALSALTGKPFRIFNVRGNRTPPGLKAQHLTGVKAVAKICNAKVNGAEIGSKELTFVPAEIKGGSFEWDIGTAGSITLVLQALMPAMLFSKKEFTISITGGTHVRWSPSIEYFRNVFCSYLNRMGASTEHVNLEIKQQGFYPKGGGKIKLRIKPCEMRAVEILERGNLKKTDIWSTASRDLQKAEVAERQIKGFKKEYKGERYEQVVSEYVESLSTGSNIHAHAHFENCKLGADEIGERGKKAEIVGEWCAKKLKQEIGMDSTVDTHMLDQIIPYLGMLGGKVKFGKTTSHAETNIKITEMFLPVKFEKKENVLECRKL